VTDARAMADPTMDAPELEAEYLAWRLQLVRSRIRVLAALIFVANILLFPLDRLLYPAHIREFLWARVFVGIAMVVAVLLNRLPSTQRRQALIFFVLVAGAWLPACWMTVKADGFASPHGHALIILTWSFAVLVPVRWRLQLASQMVVLAVYSASNTWFGAARTDAAHALASIFFLFASDCVASISVFLYERLQRGEFQARRQVEASNRKLRELDRLKSQFFANISHELRTPLTLIIGAFRSLAKLPLAEGNSAAVGAGLRNGVRLLYLINELLDLARFESGRTELHQRAFDLAPLVRQVAANFEHSLGERLHLEGLDRPFVVRGDPAQLRKVVYNLLSNAAKFSDPETRQIWVRLTSTPEAVELEIEDNGIGIASENLSCIFDRFSQVEAGATRRYEGTGIGLALAKEIVTQHGGAIECSSRVGHGSTFRVRLAKCADEVEEVQPGPDELPAAAPEPPTASSSSAPACPDPGAPLVLAADDNPDMRVYLRRILAPFFRVEIASDGEEALNKARSFAPNLILTDIMMPRMSGYDLLARLREEEKLREVPVVFLSALSAADARVAALEAGVDDMVSKPFDEEELRVRLRNLLASRRQQRQIAELRLEALRRFLPAQVAATMLESGSDEPLRTHRTEVTVVFFDLRGFTEFSEQATPEELMGVLREYQTAIGELVDGYGGTLERFTGDSIMVFFNDPLPVPDHPKRALEMALEASGLVSALEDRWREKGFRLGLGIGAATGPATLGMVGYERRWDYAALGPVTNLAARLCAAAEPGQILIPEPYVELVRDSALLTDLGTLTLRGFREPVRIFNVVRVEPAPAVAAGAR
jgi:signal transduction histidine kinase/class 3 adenylate cyclase